MVWPLQTAARDKKKTKPTTLFMPRDCSTSGPVLSTMKFNCEVQRHCHLGSHRFRPPSLLAHDEIHDRLRVFRRKRKMPFARPDNNRDLSAELLITFLDDASLAVQPGIQGAAVVQDRHACFRQRRQ